MHSAHRTFLLLLASGGIAASTLLGAACGDDAADATTTTSGAGASGSGTSNGQGGDIFGDAGPDGVVVSLEYVPASASVTVDGSGTPTSTVFELRATFDTGQTVVVQAESVEFDRPDLAALSAGPPASLTPIGDYAGTGNLRGIFKGVEATAAFTVAIDEDDVGEGVDPAAVDALDAGDLPADPAVTTLLYPYDQTVFPLGLASPLVMWAAPQAGDVVRIRYAQNGYVLDTYRVVEVPAQVRVDQQAWDFLTASNAGDPVQVTLSRYDVATATAYTSATQSWTIAPESLRGAIYYWTTSAGGHLARIQPGTGAQPSTVNNGVCMGCHAVSADGSTLVASWEGQPVDDGTGDNRAWSSWDLPSETLRVLSTSFSGTLAVSPDGKYTVYGSQTLKLGDTATGQHVESGLEALPLAPGMSGFQTPAFSPSGQRLAMVEGVGTWYHNLRDGQLVVADFDAQAVSFSNKQALAHTSAFPEGQRVLQYPSFTPDSEWVAFHATNDPDGRNIGDLWIQHVSGSAPVRLATLTDGAPDAADDNHSLEPTFNPEERGGYFWVVFTSSRQWGNRIVGVPNLEQERLWVAAIDPAIGAVDPSHPPFFLEGQEENTKNRRGFWTLSACIPTGDPTPCGAGFECCSGFCIDGVCGEPETDPCVGVGESCSTDADCCNADYVTCTGGVCQADVPD